MTPALLALSRAYLALPGAPTPKSVRFARNVDGMFWVLVPDESGRLGWVIDLTDAATGGVMLARLGDAVGIVEIGPDRIGLRYDSDCPTLGEGATLAEAVARVAVAVGRAG